MYSSALNASPMRMRKAFKILAAYTSLTGLCRSTFRTVSTDTPAASANSRIFMPAPTRNVLHRGMRHKALAVGLLDCDSGILIGEGTSMCNRRISYESHGDQEEKSVFPRKPPISSAKGGNSLASMRSHLMHPCHGGLAQKQGGRPVVKRRLGSGTERNEMSHEFT